MRDRIINIIVYAALILIAASFFYTQVVRYGYYSKLSKNNSIRIIPIEGPRGNIYDRNGNTLVSNILCFDVVVTYNEVRDVRRIAGVMKAVLGMKRDEVLRSLEKAMKRPFSPVAIAEDIGKEKAILTEEASVDIDGLSIETRSRRHYINGSSGCHVFGYLTEISESELENLSSYGYRMGDLMGRSGIEKYYNVYLKGSDGGTQVQVDNRGRQVSVLGMKEPSCGRDLQLTLDGGLQLACDELLGAKRGAVIVMDPRTGEILALASHPAFDPNVFVDAGGSRERLKLIRDLMGRPLSDRAISGLYAPGSVFKIVTASAAMEQGNLGESTTFVCDGSYRLGGTKFNCWKEEGHGPQAVRDALMNSCNVFFYNAGRKAGVDALERYSKVYGFGKRTGIDLPDEVSGLVPGRSWKRQRLKEAWYEGETLNYAIGQGFLTVTPIQVLNMMAVVANGGSLTRPFIVKKIDDTPVSSAKMRRVNVSEKTLGAIREGLFRVVESGGGTGKRARVDGVRIAGKTGTAQNTRGATHAWFSGFAPYDNPSICLVVLLEHGGKGGLYACEIAQGVFREAKERGYLDTR